MIQIHAEGAAREAICKADLLRRGFEVFIAGAGNTSFDIVAYKHGILLRVEVKGGHHKIPSTSPVASICKSLDCRKFDVLAAVEGNTVRYLRSLFHTFNAASKELVGEEVASKMTSKKNLLRRESMV
jgi:Holliday junction resolvase-like predicted endonuclease